MHTHVKKMSTISADFISPKNASAVTIDKLDCLSDPTGDYSVANRKYVLNYAGGGSGSITASNVTISWVVPYMSTTTYHTTTGTVSTYTNGIRELFATVAYSGTSTTTVVASDAYVGYIVNQPWIVDDFNLFSTSSTVTAFNGSQDLFAYAPDDIMYEMTYEVDRPQLDLRINPYTFSDTGFGALSTPTTIPATPSTTGVAFYFQGAMTFRWKSSGTAVTDGGVKPIN